MSSYQAVHGRFQHWVDSGQLEKALCTLAENPHDTGLPDLNKGLIDDGFASAKEGAWWWERTKRSKGTKIMAVASSVSIPLAVTVDSTSLHEFKLFNESRVSSFLEKLPVRLILDKADDSDALDCFRDQECGIEMIAPDRQNHGKTQDGRNLRRHKKRSAVEPLFGWLQWYRRLVTRPNFMLKTSLARPASAS